MTDSSQPLWHRSLDERLNATRARIRADIEAHPPAHIEVVRLRERTAELERENAALREALTFYADPDGDGYDVKVTDYGLSTETGDIIKDGGVRARNALGGQPS